MCVEVWAIKIEKRCFQQFIKVHLLWFHSEKCNILDHSTRLKRLIQQTHSALFLSIQSPNIQYRLELRSQAIIASHKQKPITLRATAYYLPTSKHARRKQVYGHWSNKTPSPSQNRKSKIWPRKWTVNTFAIRKQRQLQMQRASALLHKIFLCQT